MKKAMVPVLFLALFSLACASSSTGEKTDWGGLAKSTAKAAGSNLAGGLAEHFGVPAAAVTSLFESGLSLQSVVKALLISQSAKVSVDKVSSLLQAKNNDVSAVASELGVSASAYAQDKVEAVVSKVSGRAGQALDSAGQVKGAAEQLLDTAGQVKGDVDATVDALSAPPK